MSLHYNGDSSFSFVDGNRIFKFKAYTKDFNFPAQFCLGSISGKLCINESKEVSSKRNIYDFSVDYNAIDKSGILKIHKYVIVKNKTK